MKVAELGRDWLLANLPHQGAMNLLDRVVGWDATTLHATTQRHRDARHPLRHGDELPAAAGIELRLKRGRLEFILHGHVDPQLLADLQARRAEMLSQKID